jgi:hypothetical protein
VGYVVNPEFLLRVDAGQVLHVLHGHALLPLGAAIENQDLQVSPPKSLL